MKIAIIDELHDIKRSGVYYSTEALKDLYNKNGISCTILGIKKRGQFFNFIIKLPFIREFLFFPIWNRYSCNKINKEGYTVVFYQCSTSLFLLRKSSFKKVIYTRALLARRIEVYTKLKISILIKIILYIAYPFILIAERISFRNADRIVASKERFARYLSDSYKISMNKFKIAPQMVDMNIINNKNLGSDKKYDVLFIGRFSEPKNWPIMEEIARNSNLKIAAASPEMTAPKAHNKNITLFNRVPYAELSKLINECRVFVMPSFHEEGPRVTIEAMAVGLPIVASVEGSGDFIKNDINGYIVKNNDPMEYIKYINKLVDDKALVKQISKNNIKESKKFSTTNLKDAYIEAMTF